MSNVFINVPLNIDASGECLIVNNQKIDQPQLREAVLFEPQEIPDKLVKYWLCQDTKTADYLRSKNLFSTRFGSLVQINYRINGKFNPLICDCKAVGACLLVLAVIEAASKHNQVNEFKKFILGKMDSLVRDRQYSKVFFRSSTALTELKELAYDGEWFDEERFLHHTWPAFKAVVRALNFQEPVSEK
ncbi:MAG: hypothetical protein COX77_01715 [Candidatus Komeilibacteria bacterium CG_4_10_14_0_2_um_filter_37_10]|uniref:Uncharacterized protein n=1 Tax=Candidatus Komeilibacteria bacterium CG_4_10_14_0_2_um_filter_37_10 TaxID=1974470 RepID=A0A2M7VG04_9BACT|nr:MAG: hypothetical protein COX77_01715 [Candidatus Komeilibacteria bacterium CG_4_10_14_0_2_um_filter_37_10]PJA92540.1 MAG: hypothetical protein CO133_02645 [Candidatus Komeilibacteria bacterium CG_4_9_14_3_um_filter_37_5]